MKEKAISKAILKDYDIRTIGVHFLRDLFREYLTKLNIIPDVKILSTVEDIITHSDPTIGYIIVQDIDRGGEFSPYTGDKDVDNGMIFIDADDNKWIRVINDSMINVKWYGASPSNLDNLSYIEAAKDYIYNDLEFTELHIPGGVYSISDTISFNKNIKITGDGGIHYPKTELVFPAGKAGFIFSYTAEESGFGAEMENISITGQLSGGYTVTTNHAITVRTRVRMSNIVINQFDGDGFHISACALQPNGDNNNYGNADHSIFINVNAYYCTNGVFSEGCDAQVINFTNCNFSQNRRWGYLGNGLSGDYLENCHFAFNGVAVPGANSVVTYNTKYYVARYGYDGYYGDSGENLNKQPDINPNYWFEVSPPMVAYPWDNSVRYYSGGPAGVKNANAWTTFDSPYTEAYQPPIILNPRSKVTGGTNGANVIGGAFWTVLYGEQKLLNAGLTLEKYLSVGTTTYDPAAQLKIYNDYDITASRIGLKSEGSTTSFHNQIKNTITTANYGLASSDFQTLIGDVLMSNLNANGFDITGDRIRIRTAKTPANASDTGNAGEICWDTNYIYVCTATNTWKRIAITTW